MGERRNSRKLTDILLDDGQTLFVTSTPVIRYPIALALAAAGGYMFLHSPPFDMGYALVYAMIAAVYAWELSAGIMIMLAIIGIFKFLATLPLAVALVLVIVACAFIGL